MMYVTEKYTNRLYYFKNLHGHKESDSICVAISQSLLLISMYTEHLLVTILAWKILHEPDI